MIPVEIPITSVVMIRVSRRPMRSPRWPNSTPPSGRTTNPTPKVANAASVPAPDPESLKNRSPNTSAAAVP
jgi:hypothetical protein